MLLVNAIGPISNGCWLLALLNALPAISAMVYALSGTPNPLYGVVGPEYTNWIPGNAPQVGLDALYLDGLTPTILKVLSLLDAMS
jgi:hypothetical protein